MDAQVARPSGILAEIVGELGVEVAPLRRKQRGQGAVRGQRDCGLERGVGRLGNREGSAARRSAGRRLREDRRETRPR
jgi:hypothetical protein